MKNLNKILNNIKNKTRLLFNTKKKKFLSYLLLILFLFIPAYFIFFHNQVGASWWNSDWFYRKSIPVANSSGGTLTDFQVKILTNYDLTGDIANGKIQTDLDDIRFTNANGEVLDYWIEDNTNNSVDIWLKIPSLSTSGATIYFYYGNSHATAYSDGNKVFDFFDDFNDNNIDPNKWAMQNLGSGGSYAEAEGQLQLIASNNLTGSSTAKTLKNFTNNFVIEWKRFDTEQHYNNLSFGYGSVRGGAGETDYWHTVPQYGYFDKIQANNLFYYSRVDNGTQVSLETGIDGPDAGQWIKYKNIYSNAGLWNWYYDTGTGYNLLGTGHTDATYLNDEKYILLSRGGYNGNAWGGASKYDYIFVRKYASTEPTPGSLSSEEKGPSPALYLPFDEGFGATAHDETSNRNDGNIVGATWKDESSCKNGKCLEFDGKGDYVEIADNQSLDLSEELTLEAWVKPNNTNLSNQTIVSKVETPDEPTKIFRSVGPSATAAIATGTTNSMTIIGNRAIFQTSLPDNVGVGDVIQYDLDDDGDIDASDKIVFIHERVNSKEYVVKTNAGNTPDSVTNDTNWSLYRAYTSLANAEAGIENTGIDSDLRNFDDWTAGGDATTNDVGKDLVAANQQWNIACYANGTTADTSAVTVNGWTTGFFNLINIYTPVSSSEVGVSQRHNGKWDSSKYILETNNNNDSLGIVMNSSDKFIVDGLQVKNNYNNRNAIGTGYVGGTLIVKNLIIQGNNQVSSGIRGINLDSGSSGYRYIYNNIIYNLGTVNTRCISLSGTGKGYYIYNNTCYGADIGFNVGTTYNNYFKNNVTQQNVTSFGNPSNITGASNNISSDGTAPGTNSKINTTVSFISTTAGSEDFHLSPTDTAAKDSGADLSGDNYFPFASDIDGQSRLGRDAAMLRLYNDNKWDIGADEAQATQIYRSVAPGKTDALETGEENSLTIVGNVATFQRALADNIGVGDVIQYDDDNDGDIDSSDSLAFVTGRISNFQFTISNASGGVPTEVINDNDWSLFRAYTSLANAENGDENTGINSDLRNFDTWTGGKDLVASKEQWNITCYANGTTADTTAVTVNGWTTGVQNFVNIYTPVSESEVGVSQRHNGKWDDDKYRLSVNGDVIVSSNRYTILDGLQMEEISSGSRVIVAFNSGAYLINSIVRGDAQGLTSIGVQMGNSGNLFYIYNNIIYNMTGRGIVDSSGSGGFGYIYNNTIFNCGIGANLGTKTNSSLLKNNLFSNNANDVLGTVANGSDYNVTNKASLEYTVIGGGNTHDKLNQTFSFTSTTYGSEDLHLTPTDTAARNAGVDLSVDANLPIRTDIDGERRDDPVGRLYDIGADEAAPTKIYRSVGPGNTSALATDENHENTVEVTDGRASFAKAMAAKIGVGDAVLIDTNSDNAITSADTLLFIHGRNSSTSYDLRTHTGEMPANISSNDTYQIFRAYTSLANAEAGTKNTSIPITFNGGNRDLVANNEEWNIACYGDGADTTAVIINNWNTNKENYIKVYTPMHPNEVGVSQRHNGKWDNKKYYLSGAAFSLINLHDNSAKIEGLQLYQTNVGNSTYRAIRMNGTAAETFFNISNNIFRGDYLALTSGSGYAIYNYNTGTGKNYIYNNIFYDFASPNSENSSAISLNGGTNYVYSNTFYDNEYGINVGASTTVIAKNNIVNNAEDGYRGTFTAGSDFNISNLASDAPGANSKNSTNVVFRDSANDDFRLAMNDAAAKGAGLNLTYDVNNPVREDVEGEKRPSLVNSHQSSMITDDRLPMTAFFDIGADQISSTTHNNYSLNLKNNYPQANFSTSDNDRDNFSSGDINLEANKWSYLVYKRNADSEELFINGSKKDTNTISNFLKTNNGKLYIGAKNSSSENSFKGLIDEIRIYPYARTESEVKKDTAQGSAGIAAQRASEGVSVSMGDKAQTLSDGLVGYWKMDEMSGTAVTDSSGNGNNGVLTNAQETGTSDATGNTTTTLIDTDGALSTIDDAYNGMIFRTTAACGSITSGTERIISDYTGATKTFTFSAALANAPDNCPYEIRHQVGGRYGNGLSFDGVNDYARVVPPNFVEDQENITFSVWAKASVISPAKGYLIRAVVNNNQDIFRMYVAANNTFNCQVYNSSGEYSTLQIGNQFTDLNWHHFVGVYRQGVAELYVDGKLISKGSAIIGKTRTGESVEHFTIGSEWPGALDEVRTYNRALSPDEVKKLYEYAPGPVMHLKMDEKEGAIAYDSSGNNYNTDLNSNSSWLSGKIGGGINFPANSFGKVQNSTGLTNNWGAFTIGAWIKMDAIPATAGYVFLSKYRSGFGGWRLSKDRNNATGKFVFSFYNQDNTKFQQLSSSVWPSDLNWHYITIVYDGNYLNMYGDGKSIATSLSASGRLQDLTHAVCISGESGGAICGSIDSLSKNMDEIKIYNYARTQEQILEDMGASAHSSGNLQEPILDLSFDEGYGSITHDSSGVGNDGTLTNMTAIDWVGGKFGKALDFDGGNDHVIVASSTNMDLANKSFTLSAWAKRDSIDSTDMIMGQGTSINYNGLHFGFRSTNVFTCAFWGADLDTNEAYTDMDWHHWLCTYDADTNKRTIYRDGIAVKSDTLIADYQGTGDLIIGNRMLSQSMPFGGLIDEVKIYNYTLGEDEVKTLYNGGSSMSLGGETTSANNNGTTVSGDAAEYCIPGDTAKCDKPVLELKMDEKSGTIAYDTSGNGNNATITGATWDRGKNGGALSFDGNGDYVDVPSLDNTNFPQDSSTISMWLKVDCFKHIDSNDGFIFDRYAEARKHFFIRCSPASTPNNLQIVAQSIPTYAAASYLYVDENWNHISVVRDKIAEKMHTYLNGKLVTSVNLISSWAPDGQDSILGYSSIGSPTALMDDVKVYNYARTPAQIAWDYNRGKPIAHWKFDEGENTVIHDENINQNSSTVIGATWQNESSCKIGKCLSFDGDNDAVVSNGNVDLSKTDKASISMWFKYNNAASAIIMLEHSSDFNSNNAFMIDHSESGVSPGGRLAMGDNCGVKNTIYTNEPFGDNNWHHFVGVIDRSLGGDQNKIYIDGKIAETSVYAGGNCNGNFGSFPLYVGARGGTTLDYTGLIDDVKIFNYALNAEQVKQDYAGSAINFK